MHDELLMVILLTQHQGCFSVSNWSAEGQMRFNMFSAFKADKTAIEAPYGDDHGREGLTSMSISVWRATCADGGARRSTSLTTASAAVLALTTPRTCQNALSFIGLKSSRISVLRVP
jgi:hypothetical protein